MPEEEKKPVESEKKPEPPKSEKPDVTIKPPDFEPKRHTLKKENQKQHKNVR